MSDQTDTTEHEAPQKLGGSDSRRLLDGILARPQRQDATIDQLHDLVRVANRLGMYDAADAMRQAFELGKFSDIGRVDPLVMRRMLIQIYNSGYLAGHHDTVEGGYVDIFSCNMNSYHEEEVDELVAELTMPMEAGLEYEAVPPG